MFAELRQAVQGLRRISLYNARTPLFSRGFARHKLDTRYILQDQGNIFPLLFFIIIYFFTNSKFEF